MGGMRRRGRWMPWLAALVVGVGAGLPATPAYATPPAPPAPLAPADASGTVSQVAPTIVDIDTDLRYQGAVGAGTGIVLDPNGEVLTNNHVIEGATDIRATSVGNGRSYQVNVIGFDRTHDIALLQLEGAGDLVPAALGSSAQLAVGDPVIAIGNAGGGGGFPSAAPGRVTALNQTVSVNDEISGGSKQLDGLIQVTGDIREGDSGGPLVNSAGQVVGVTTAATVNYRMESHGGFAVPIDQALAIAGQIRSGAGGGTVHVGDTAFIGIGVVDAGGGPNQSASGALVQRVMANTPAEQLGLVRGDIIVSVDGNIVDSATALTDLMDQHHPGDNIELGWLDRSGEKRTGTVTLAAGPVG
jgi:S1-C subfamily serine protease